MERTTAVVSIDINGINRALRESYDKSIYPDLSTRLGSEGALGRYLYACVTAHILGPPVLGLHKPGELSLRMPLEGKISIPYGKGWRFMVEAEASVRPILNGNSLVMEMGDVSFDDLRIGDGCSLPPEVLSLLGPFVTGLIEGSSADGVQSFEMDLDRLAFPVAFPGMEPTSMSFELEDFVLGDGKALAYVGFGGSILVPDPLEDRDLAMAIPEGDITAIVNRLGEAGPIEVEEISSFDLFDQHEIVELFMAGAESLVTLGRQGLGKREIKGSSNLRYQFKARVGMPQVKIREGGLIELLDIPAHLTIDTALLMDTPPGSVSTRFLGFMDRLRNRGTAETAPSDFAQMGRWYFDRDIVLPRAVLAVRTDEKGLLAWDVKNIDPFEHRDWPLPRGILGRLMGTVAERIARSRTPPELLGEIPLPMGLPMSLRLQNTAVSSVEGCLFVSADVAVQGKTGHPVVVPEVVEMRPSLAMPFLGL